MEELMKYKTLSNGVLMPTIGLGVDTLKGDDVIKSVISAIESGVRLIDTASCYKNEKEVGIAINECIKRGIVKREELFICSKAPYHQPGYENTLNGYQRSLKLLNLDYLDLYLLHSPYWNSSTWKSDIIESWKALCFLYESGQCRAIGCCNFNSRLFLDVLETSTLLLPHVIQVECHPQHQNNDCRRWCNENNVQFQSWGTLNQGRVFKSQLLKEIANKYNKSISQIAIRWNIQKGNSCLFRSTKTERIKENVNVFDFEISEIDMDKIDTLDNQEWSNIHSFNKDFCVGGISIDAFFDILNKQINREDKYTEIYKLFGFIPFLKKKNKGNIERWYLFGIKILKIYKK